MCKNASRAGGGFPRPARGLLAALFFAIASSAQTDPANRAYEALRVRDYDAAVAAFLQALQLKPERIAVRKDLAYTYLKIGENVLARDQFHEAMRLDPNDLQVTLEYAFLCNETKEPAEARRIFDRLRKSG